MDFITRIVVIYLFFMSAASIGLSFETDNTELPEYHETIQVTGRLATLESDTNRAVIVFSREEIKALPVTSISGILRYVCGIDVQQRGAEGVQADISIRGASTNQTLVMIDGVPMTDSQTGHHTLDLPVTADDIERIEILKGLGSGAMGPAAYQGSVNVATRKATRSGLSFQGEIGNHHTSGGTARFEHVSNGTNLCLNIQRKISQGYHDNTEYAFNKLFINGSTQLTNGMLSFAGGASENHFGAYKFYTDAYPNQWEGTETCWSYLKHETDLGNIRIASIVNWRKHTDDFILDRERPDWYRNQHETDQYSGRLTATIPTKYADIATGVEWRRNHITSSSLGNHNRQETGFFLESHSSEVRCFTVSAGVSGYYFDEIGWEFSPSADIGWKMNQNLSWFAAAGRSYRLPTFTELYYDSPANIGNSNLQPEKIVSIESGLKWINPGITGEICVFFRRGVDQIDWARNNDSDPWQVMNIADVRMTGAEISFMLIPEHFFKHLHVNRIQAFYTYLNSNYDAPGVESKYVAAHLEHQAIVQINHRFVFLKSLNFNWSFRYEDRVDDPALLLSDLRVAWKNDVLEISCEIGNLGNKRYDSVTGVPMQGRSITAGLAVHY
ncbi:TonB-dependent receptor [bacterium]|nr:TonB-dependent receptor [bacterium]